jgi:hypothetical protein
VIRRSTHGNSRMSKALETRIVALETENHIQYKEIFYRLKRLEVILLGGATAVIGLLVNVLVMVY